MKANAAPATPAPPRDLNTHHLFTAPSTREAWETRAKELREQILCSAGLWPMPEHTPLHPQITGRYEGPDFIIENVALTVRPGVYLCGNLYHPKGKKGPFPAIVNPHGHWKNGRLERQEEAPQADPPPAAPGPGRADLVAIGVNLARHGYVVFAYDMVGYNDTAAVDHNFARGLEPWQWGVSLNGLQLWNGIRAVDYVASLPDVDTHRIGATGASGGGTQVFLLAAVDDRVKVSVPVNMVSASMQGGCLCENGPGLRVGTDNVEIAALCAPRPQLLVAATGDWTRNVPHEEGPRLREVYELFGVGDRTAVQQFNYQHNYNRESREAMYAFFEHHLNGKKADTPSWHEEPFTVDLEAMRVWNAAHPQPADALKEPELIAALREDAVKQRKALWPHDARSLSRFRETYAPALRHALAIPPLQPAAPHAIARNPAIIVAPEGREAESEAVRAALQAKGYTVADVLLLPPLGPEADPAHLDKNFFTTYNQTPLGSRVQQIATALLHAGGEKGPAVTVVGLGAAGPWALLARAVSGTHGATVADLDGFDMTDDAAFLTRLYAPGLRRAGDLRTAAVLAASGGPLCLAHPAAAHAIPDEISAGCRAMGATLRIAPRSLTAAEIADWLGDAPAK